MSEMQFSVDFGIVIIFNMLSLNQLGDSKLFQNVSCVRVEFTSLPCTTSNVFTSCWAASYRLLYFCSVWSRARTFCSQRLQTSHNLRGVFFFVCFWFFFFLKMLIVVDSKIVFASIRRNVMGKQSGNIWCNPLEGSNHINTATVYHLVLFAPTCTWLPHLKN